MKLRSFEYDREQGWPAVRLDTDEVAVDDFEFRLLGTDFPEAVTHFAVYYDNERIWYDAVWMGAEMVLNDILEHGGYSVIADPGGGAVETIPHELDDDDREQFESMLETVRGEDRV